MPKKIIWGRIKWLLNETIFMSQTKTNTFSQEDIEMFQMLNGLVLSLTGLSIDQIPEDKRDEIVNTCIEYFTKWIELYMTKNFDKKDAIRIHAISSSGKSDEIFEKFSDLGDKFDTAWEAFFQEQNQKWTNKLEDSSQTKKIML